MPTLSFAVRQECSRLRGGVVFFCLATGVRVYSLEVPAAWRHNVEAVAQSDMAMAETYRRWLAGIATASFLFLVSCGAPAPRAEQTKPDPTKETAYAKAIEQLAALNQKAEDLIKRGRTDEAAAMITKGQPIQASLLAAPHPTLAAMEAISDLDNLYARMLLANRNDVWARTFYVKNVTRWKMWEPQTADTSRRLQQAEAGILECDRHLRERRRRRRVYLKPGGQITIGYASVGRRHLRHTRPDPGGGAAATRRRGSEHPCCLARPPRTERCACQPMSPPDKHG